MGILNVSKRFPGSTEETMSSYRCLSRYPDFGTPVIEKTKVPYGFKKGGTRAGQGVRGNGGRNPRACGNELMKLSIWLHS